MSKKYCRKCIHEFTQGYVGRGISGTQRELGRPVQRLIRIRLSALVMYAVTSLDNFSFPLALALSFYILVSKIYKKGRRINKERELVREREGGRGKKDGRGGVKE